MFKQTALIQTLMEHLATERAAYRALVEQMLTMRRDGFQPAAPPTPGLDALAPVVLDALSEVPESARDRVRVWAWEETRRAVDPELIAAQIRNGA